MPANMPIGLRTLPALATFDAIVLTVEGELALIV